MISPAPPPPMPKWLVVCFGSYFVILDIVLIYLLVRVWPTTIPIPANEHTVAWLPGWAPVPLPDEWRYLIVVVLAGALGSYIHFTTSFADYVGNRSFFRSWGAWYILRPFIGSTLALVLYFVIRAGLIVGGTGSGETLSFYGVAAISGMAGLFTKQATDKLSEVFDTIFLTKVKPNRANPLQTHEMSGPK